MTRRPCAGEPAFPSGDNLGANENGSAHAEAQGGSSQPQAPANGAANGVEHTTAADIAASYPVGKGVSDRVVLTALHNEIPLDQFTVPRLWYELKVRTFAGCCRDQELGTCFRLVRSCWIKARLGTSDLL